MLCVVELLLSLRVLPPLAAVGDPRRSHGFTTTNVANIATTGGGHNGRYATVARAGADVAITDYVSDVAMAYVYM
jgi:hypothetical protein